MVTGITGQMLPVTEAVTPPIQDRENKETHMHKAEDAEAISGGAIILALVFWSKLFSRRQLQLNYCFQVSNMVV